MMSPTNLIIMGILGAASWFLWNNYFKYILKKTPQKTPQELLKEVILRKRMNLQKAERVLARSEAAVREAERRVANCKNDIEQLDNRVKQAIKDKKDEAAKRYLKQHDEAISDLARHQANLQEQTRSHEEVLEEVRNFKKEIQNIEDNAANLEMQLQREQVKRDTSAKDFTVDEAETLLRGEIEATQMEADYEQEDPHQEMIDILAAQEREEEDADLERRLQAMKDEMEN